MNCKVCGNTSAKNTSLSFFRFPKENSKCRDWAERCHLLALFEKHGPVRFYKSFRICSKHFDPKHIVFDGRKYKLLNSAIPHLKPVAKNPSTQGNVNISNFPNLCRLCAKEDDKLIDIFGWKGRLFSLETKLQYFPQVINKRDILPHKICNRCMSKVNQFYDFIINSLRAETKLRAMLNTKPNKPSTHSPLKLDHHSAMETTSNQPPKANLFLTALPDKNAVNSYHHPLKESVIPHDTAPQANHNTPYFPKSVISDHDYLGSQLLPTSMGDTKFCHVPQDGEVSGPRPPPKESLDKLYDGASCSRSSQSRPESKTRPQPIREQTFGESCESGERFSKKKVRPPQDKKHSEDSLRCTKCGRVFRSKACLRQHSSVHSDRRPHRCRECDKSYKRKDALRSHVRTHTGERPYLCKTCGFTFKHRGDCIHHENNHEKYDDR